MTKIGVITFPGTNCDHDIIAMSKNIFNASVNEIWHTDTSVNGCDVVILPGGFAYGDYLRTGALAKLSPIMNSVIDFANKGGTVIGICNGFQILCESGLLPGVLLQNVAMKFLSRFVHMRVESDRTPMTKNLKKGTVIPCPIAHFEGNYFVDSEKLKDIEDNNQVLFRYCSPDGKVDSENREWNPNGSINSIAGVTNKKGNVLGFMPHPERNIEGLIANNFSTTGTKLFENIINS